MTRVSPCTRRVPSEVRSSTLRVPSVYAVVTVARYSDSLAAASMSRRRSSLSSMATSLGSRAGLQITVSLTVGTGARTTGSPARAEVARASERARSTAASPSLGSMELAEANPQLPSTRTRRPKPASRPSTASFSSPSLSSNLVCSTLSARRSA
jgi:hypothetical protein